MARSVGVPLIGMGPYLSLGYGPPQNSGLMGIDLGRATLAKTRTRTIRAAAATTTLFVFAFRTSFHAQFVLATGARTGRSVGMANAPNVGCYMCA